MPHNQQYFSTMLNQTANFTEGQRSQQARGKSYTATTAGEHYEARQEREQAAQVLGSLELLVWHSNARNESTAQTRQHFQNAMLGLPDEPPIYKEEYQVPPEHRVKRNEAGEIVHGSPRSAKGKEKMRQAQRSRTVSRVERMGSASNESGAKEGWFGDDADEASA